MLQIINNIFQEIIQPSTRFIVIHSSLLHFRIPLEKIKWPLLQALNQVSKNGITIIVPSFTFSFTKSKLFDVLNSPSEVGVLGDWVGQLSNAVRSRHPIYSFAVLGEQARKIVSLPINTCFSKDSLFGFLDRNNTIITMFGCDWKYCTQFHYYEAEHQVPYRYNKIFSGKIIHGNKEKTVSTSMYVRQLEINAKNDFSEIVHTLRDNNKITKQYLGSGIVESVHCADLAEVSRNMLEKDPYRLVKNPRKVSYLINCLHEKEKSVPYKTAILGNSNVSFLKSELEKKAKVYITSNKVEVFIPQYGQVYQEIIDNNSKLHKFNARCVFFTDRLEDIHKVEFLDALEKGDFSVVETYLSMIERFADKTSGQVIVNSFIQMQPSASGTADSASPQGVSAFIAGCNKKLYKSAEKFSNIHVLDMQTISNYAEAKVYDDRLWFLGRFPFSYKFTEYLAQKYLGIILALTGRSARLLVLDLDNTLWGGVLGEEGITGVQLGGDFPGNAYASFQKQIKHLFNRGMALAVVSKNDQDYALEVINGLSNMEFRQSDLAAYRINWQEKVNNINEISDELSLGLENILFVDDNPVEREKVKVNCPEVKVLELPSDPALYGKALFDSPYIDCLHVTDEDKKRGKYYADKRVLKEKRSSFSNVDDFYLSLKMKVYINKLNENNSARTVQLINKTNQFNTTAKRYSLVELHALQKKRFEVYVIGFADRFTSYENIGVIILDVSNAEEIDIGSFLLSCRVLDKGIENTVLAWVLNFAEKRKFSTIKGEIREAKRNTPVRTLYEKHGFSMIADTNIWQLNINSGNLPVPRWITLIDKTEEV